MARPDDLEVFMQGQATSVTIKVSDDFQTFKLSDDAGVSAAVDGRPIAELKHVLKRMPLAGLSFHYNTISQSPDAEIYVLDVISHVNDFEVLDLTVGKFHSRVEDAIVTTLLHDNPTLKSLTLRIHSDGGAETPLRKFLTPFIFKEKEKEKEKARVKKLVLLSIDPNSHGTPIEHKLDQVIHHNDELKHLEVGDGVFAPSKEGTTSLNSNKQKGDAIWRNKTLEVLRLQCTSQEFKLIVDHGLIPSRNPNTTLRTLRVSLRDSEKLVWWEDLVKLVASTRALEHVEVLGPKDTSDLKKKFQKLCKNELKARTRASSTERELLSVTVGSLKAVFNAGQWEIQ